MQKVISTLLLSSVSAKNELFLNKHIPERLEERIQADAINIDVDKNQIAPCQYFTNTAIFNVQGITDKDL